VNLQLGTLGILISSGGNNSLENCSFTDFWPKALLFESSSFSVEVCIFLGGANERGLGLKYPDFGIRSAISIVNSLGGLISNSQFLGLSGSINGSSVWISDSNVDRPVDILIHGCLFNQSSANLAGGSIFISMAQVNLKKCYFDKNKAHIGGSIFFFNKSKNLYYYYKPKITTHLTI
jgi:hypothetical protein